MTANRRAPLGARLFAVVGWAAAVVGAIGAIALRIVDQVPVVRNPFGFGDVALVGFGVMGLAFASVGALLVVRRPALVALRVAGTELSRTRRPVTNPGRSVPTLRTT